MRGWVVVLLGLAALSLVACPGGESGAQVPRRVEPKQVEELAYAVPDGFEEPSEPTDPQAVSVLSWSIPASLGAVGHHGL